jgi:hypothetical protein
MRLAWPQADLSARVTQRICARPTGGRRAWQAWPQSRLARAVFLAVLVMAVGLALSPRARAVVADLLRVGGITIRRVGALPTPTARPTTSPAGTPTALGADLELGRFITLDEAAELVDFSILVPRLEEIGAPHATYVGPEPRGGRVSLVYAPNDFLPTDDLTGVGLLVMQFQASHAELVGGKLAPPEASIEAVSVRGRPALWISGAPHELVFYRDVRGEARYDPLRLAGNTLLWEENGLTVRLESALSLAQAIRVAESMR